MPDHVIKYGAADIRAALFDQAHKEHPKLFQDKTGNITLEGEGNAIVATLTFQWKSTGSAWD